jgi:4'-phosphopantetheinyl transferase
MGTDMPGPRGFERRELSPDEIHVFHFQMERFDAALNELGAVLSPDERDRAGRFARDRDRRWFVVARGLLRHLLAAYLDAPPGEIRFRHGPFGKPELAGNEGSGPRLHFNLSHAGGRVAYAFARHFQVGMDIEPLRHGTDWPSLAPLVFSPEQQAELASLPHHRRAEAFLRGWTRKEAYLKTRGEGLFLPLTAFDVSLGSLREPEPVMLRGEAGTPSWWLHPIAPVPGHCVALGAASPTATIRYPMAGRHSGDLP